MTRYTVTCPACRAYNNIDIGPPVNIIEDTVRCFCGAALPLPKVPAMDVEWVPSQIVGQKTLDSITGAFRKSLEIYPAGSVEEMMARGVVMRVYGDSDDAVRSLAELVCRWHNERLDNATVR